MDHCRMAAKEVSTVKSEAHLCHDRVRKRAVYGVSSKVSLYTHRNTYCINFGLFRTAMSIDCIRASTRAGSRAGVKTFASMPLVVHGDGAQEFKSGITIDDDASPSGDVD